MSAYPPERLSRQGIFTSAPDGLRHSRPNHRHRPQRGLRPSAEHHPVRRRARCHHHSQRHGLRPRCPGSGPLTRSGHCASPSQSTAGSSTSTARRSTCVPHSAGISSPVTAGNWVDTASKSSLSLSRSRLDLPHERDDRSRTRYRWRCVAAALEALRVDCVFTVASVHNLPILHVIRRRGGIRVINCATSNPLSTARAAPESSASPSREPVASVLTDLLSSSLRVTYPMTRATSTLYSRRPVEFGVQFAGVADLLQVRPLALDVPEQGLDPGLVGRRAGRPKCCAIASRP